MDSRLWWLALGAFAGSVESAVIVGFLPAIAAETGVTVAQAGMMVFGYSVAYGLGTPILSTLFGKRHRRWVVVLAEFVFGCAALAIGVLPGLLALVLARTGLALGAGLFTSTAQSTAVALAAPGQRGKAISTVVLGGSLAVAFGAPLGALAGQVFGWRVTYFALGILAIAVAASMWRGLPNTIAGDARSLRERLAVIKEPGVPITLLASLLGALAMFFLLTYLAPVTTDFVGIHKDLIPVVMLAFGLGAIAGNQVGGRLTDRYGARQTMLVVMGLLLVLLAALPVFAVLPRGVVLPAYLVHMALFGCATWSFFPPQLIRLAALAPKSMILTASLNLTAMNIGGALSALLGGLVLGQLGAGAIGWAGAVVAVAALVAVYVAPDRHEAGAPPA